MPLHRVVARDQPDQPGGCGNARFPPHIPARSSVRAKVANIKAIVDYLCLCARIPDGFMLYPRSLRVVDSRIHANGKKRPEADQQPRDGLFPRKIVERPANPPRKPRPRSGRLPHQPGGEVSVVHPAMNHLGAELPHDTGKPPRCLRYAQQIHDPQMPDGNAQRLDLRRHRAARGERHHLRLDHPPVQAR